MPSINARIVFSRVVTLLCFGLVAGQGCHAESDDAPAGEVYVFDEALGDRGQMEIYFPKNHDRSKPVPGVILFHGGAWVSGHLKDFRFQAHYLASRGLVAATSHYELAPKGGGKDAQGRTKQEITNASGKRAIRWFRSHAAELGIDPDRIIAGGGSAGAQTALLASLHPGLNHPDDDASIDCSVSAYLLFNPATGLANGLAQKQGATTYVMTHAKPLELPPTIALFGTSDPYLASFQPLYDTLVEAGAPDMEIWYGQWAGHGFFKDQPWRDLCVIQVDRFLTRLGYLEGEPTLSVPEGGAVLTQDPSPQLTDEVAARQVHIFRKNGHSKGCTQPGKANWLETAPTMTIAEALAEGMMMCPSCQPALPQCEHERGEANCRDCRKAASSR